MRKYLYLLGVSALLPSVSFAQEADEVIEFAEPVSDDTGEADGRIVITATGTAQPIEDTGKTITVIDQAQIDEIQGADITRVLERVPGVVFNRNGGVGSTTSLRIRGSSNDQVLTLIDGVRVADPSSVGEGYDFTNLLPGNIERIEVLRGSNSVIWGSSAVGGVVLVTTEQPRTGGSASVEYGARDTIYLHGDAGYGTERFGVSVYGSHFDTEGFSALASGTEDDGFNQTAIGTHAYLALGDAVTLRASGRYSDSLVDIDNGGDTLDTQATEQYSGHIGADVALGAADIVAAYSFAVTDRVSTSAFGPFEADGRLDRLDLRAAIGLSPTLQLNTGGYYEWTGYTTNYDGDATLERRGGYAQLDYGSGPLHLAAGARLSDGTLFGSDVTFGADASYRLSDVVRARASFGQGYKTPSLYQLYDAFSGNPALTPERSDNYDIGIEAGFADGPIFAALTFYLRDIENQIDFDPATFVFFNSGEVQAKGIEIEAGIRPVPGFALRAAYAYLDTDIRNGANAGNEQGRRPPHALTLSADWTSPFVGLELGADLRVVGSSFDTDANIVRLDAYQVFDLRVAMPLDERFELFGRVENLFDEDYQTAAGYNTPGRGVFGGVRARF